MEKKKRIRKYDVDELRNHVMTSTNIRDVLNKYGKKGGGAHGVIKRRIIECNIDTSHFETAADRMRKIHVEAQPLSEIMVKNSTYSRCHLKKRLYDSGIKKRECELCGQGEEWTGKHMSLILDHINGVNNDNRKENLRIVCPNCNATLDTHAGKNIKNIKNQKRCIDCKCKVTQREARCKPCSLKTKSFISSCMMRRKVKNRPSQEQLHSDIKELGYCGTGRKYSVSDNAIRKWISLTD